MKKMLLGLAFIWFGILLLLLELEHGFALPIIDDFPWDLLGWISGIVGLVIAIKSSRDH